MQQWIKDLLDYIINKYLGLTEYEAKWIDKDETDPAVVATVNTTYLKAGVLTINEIREEIGYAGIGSDGDELMIYGASGATLLKDIINPPEPPPNPFGQPTLGVDGKPIPPVPGQKQIPGAPQQKQLPPGQKPEEKPVEKHEHGNGYAPFNKKKMALY